MRVLEPVAVMVVTMVVLTSAIPMVPGRHDALRESHHKAVPEHSLWSRGGASANLAKFLEVVTLKAAPGSHGVAQKSKKKDLSKVKFEESENTRIEKKSLEGMSEEKRSIIEKEMRVKKKRAVVEAQNQEKALKKLAKKHESLSGGKKTKKSEKDIHRMKREVEKAELKKVKLAKETERERKSKKDLKKKAKIQKELSNDKFLKKTQKHMHDKTMRLAQKFKDGWVPIDDNASLLKIAQPYMKEGRTLEERRALKALRLRVKREEAGRKGVLTQTKDSASGAFRTQHLKDLRKFREQDTKRAAAQGEKKPAMKGKHFFLGRKKNFESPEDEVNGNELGDIEVPHPGVGTIFATDDETEVNLSNNAEDIETSSEALPSINDLIFSAATPPVTYPAEFNEYTGTTYEEPSSSGNSENSLNTVDIVTLSSIDSPEPEEHTRVTYEEPSSSGNSENSLNAFDIVTLSSIDASESHNNDIVEIISDDLVVSEVPEIGDNSLIPDVDEINGERKPELGTEIPGTGAHGGVTNEAPAIGETEAPASSHAEAPVSIPRVPWPWEITEEGSEPCGRARFGPETRRNRASTMLKILEGKEALPGSFPWQVAILDEDRDFYCGGTLIAPRWVMTAAHCVRKRLRVRFSEHHIRERDGYEVEQKVRRVFTHPNYNTSTIDNDIALLRLPALPPIPDNVTGRPTLGITDKACLPEHGEHFPPVGTRCLVMGWGKGSVTSGGGTDVLMYTRLPIISRKACRRANRKNITENMFCAGHYKGGSDTCSGDSGGPLLCSIDGREEVWTVFGVTSFGDGCGVAGKMGVYAKVNNYLEWMAGIMKRYVF